MTTPAVGEPMIQLQKVVKTFKNAAGEFRVLKGVDLTLRQGEFVAIVGKSGSGKSTLINVITGIDRPTSGEVVIAGTPIHDLSEEQIAIWRGRSIGVIFQFFQLLPTLTSIENILLAMDYGGHYRATERAERAMAPGLEQVTVRRIARFQAMHVDLNPLGQGSGILAASRPTRECDQQHQPYRPRDCPHGN